MPSALRPFSRYLFGLHILNGWVVIGGVLCAALASAALLGQQAGIVAMTGALCVSIADVPSPTRHKLWELGIATLLAATSSLLGGLAALNEVSLGVTVWLLCFVSAMGTAYGRKAMPNAFAILLAMFLTLGARLPDVAAVLRHSALMLCGGLLYIAYGMVAARLTERRMKRLAIGECLREFASYLHEKARCYRTDVSLPEQYRMLVTRQMVLTERLQLARELVFRACRDDADARLVAVLRTLIDAVETILATHTDYEQLRTRHGNDALLQHLADLAEAVASEVCALAFVLLRGRGDATPLSFEAPVEQIAQALERAQQDAARQTAADAQQGLPAEEGGRRPSLMLGVSFNKLRYGITQVEALHRLLLEGRDAPAPAMPSADYLSAFTQHFSFSPKIVTAQLSWNSPVLRHAIRMSLAVTTGYILATLLPWERHGSWIMLTVAVIMRAQFSLTRQRRADRLFGNVFGCVIAALLLRFLPTPAVLAAVLVAVGGAHAFATVQYRIASTFACVMALLQLHFLAPGSGGLFVERVTDTAIGTLIAFAFSYLLPYWENSFLPTQLKALLAALTAFAQEALRLPSEDRAYRLSRKSLLEAIGVFSGALQRARSEPVANEVTLDAMNDCVVSGYLLASQLASIRFYERRMAAEVVTTAVLDDEDMRRLDGTRTRVLALLSGAMDATAVPVVDEATRTRGEVSALFARRLIYIEQEAGVLASLAEPILTAPTDTHVESRSTLSRAA